MTSSSSSSSEQASTIGIKRRLSSQDPRGPFFRETTSANATSLTDGVRLATPHQLETSAPVIMPWMGFGTYRLGKEQAFPATQRALEAGYRAIDTAFIYSGETTERAVGRVIEEVCREGENRMSREELFVTTKHWRKYHGYDATLECLRLSLSRLGLDYVDLWLMHWPGPAYKTMARRKDVDPWDYTDTTEAEMIQRRANTWRAMEDAARQGRVRAIGVSNMSVAHLKTLKKTATLWPPAVNQVELHPLYPQTELLDYCRAEGIVVQAYASLGGQDTGKAAWSRLLGATSTKKTKMDLLHAPPVVDLAHKLQATPAQVLLRWSLEKGCALIPKTCSAERLRENAGVFQMHALTQEQVLGLQVALQQIVRENNPEASEIEELTRLCWRSDPLRHLTFD